MKTKFLKNYTSDVPTSQTVYRIEQVLIKCGVSGITKEYGTAAEVVAIRFHIQVVGREMTVRLPANTERALDALWSDYVDGDELTPDGKRLAWARNKKKTRADFAQQSNRTAWKLVQDWVEVQMSMIQLNQAEPEEVFMSYIWDGQQTLYHRVKGNGFRALLPERSGELNDPR